MVTGLRVTDANVAALGAHAEARRTLAALGEADLARGAAIVSTVAAYTLAARPAPDAAALERAVEALSAFVTSIEPERRGFVAGLLDAAIAAQVATRMAAGLPPPGRRIDGWMAAAAEAAVADDAPSFHHAVSPAAALRYATASRADDVDAVLCAVAPVVLAMAEAAEHGAPSAAQTDFVQTHGLALCVRPAATAAEAVEVRPTVRILRKTLRRRRPLAAAILGARLEADGRTWGAFTRR